MSTAPASFKGHPSHPILVAFPIGLWIFSIVSDLIFKFGYGGPVWNDVAFYTLAGGIAGINRFARYSEPKIKVDRYLAHDHQPARGRALLREFLVTNTKRPGGQS